MKAISENTTKMAGGAVMQYRFYDIINGNTKQETRTAEEIIEHIRGKLNGCI